MSPPHRLRVKESTTVNGCLKVFTRFSVSNLFGVMLKFRTTVTRWWPCWGAMEPNDPLLGQQLEPNSIPTNTSFLVFINTRSGSRQGEEIIQQLKKLPHCYVFDVAQFSGCPKEDLIYQEFRQEVHNIIQTESEVASRTVRAIVGGGDGTVTWLYQIWDWAQLEPVPLATLPLGVGNELSRSTGWSNSFPSGSAILGPLELQLKKFIQRASIGKEIPFDRWNIRLEKYPSSTSLLLEEEEEEEEEERLSSPESSESKTMMCFFSIGFDAQITHKFHRLRETSPRWTSSQSLNKLWYSWYGIEEVVSPFKRVSSIIQLEVDGVPIDLPNRIRTLQVFNIHSSADGIDFFGGTHSNTRSNSGDLLKKFSAPLLGDGLLEVVGTDGVLHLLKTRAKFGHSHRIAQGKEILIRVLETTGLSVPFQLDGEAWTESEPMVIHIQLKDKVPVVRGPGPTRSVPDEVEIFL